MKHDLQRGEEPFAGLGAEGEGLRGVVQRAMNVRDALRMLLGDSWALKVVLSRDGVTI